MVALLRGVNVGGNNKLAKGDFVAAVESCGYDDVRTYIQSGNVVFSTSKRSTETVAAAIHEALADRCGITVDVMVRTKVELQAVVDDSPFLERGEDPAHLHVVFMHGSAQAALPDGLDVGSFAPEDAIPVGRELRLFLPSGVGRSKLAAQATKRSKKDAPSGTMRNWRTVTKLLEMASETP